MVANSHFRKSVAVFAMILLAFTGAMLLTAAFSERAHAASPDLTTPAITSIDMRQSYIILEGLSERTDKYGNHYVSGRKKYACWTDSSVIDIEFSNAFAPSEGEQGDSGDCQVEYYLERSTSPSSGFRNITEENKNLSLTWKSCGASTTTGAYPLQEYSNGHYKATDISAKRGSTYYYRVVAKYTRHDQSQGETLVAEKTSGLVSIRTTPKAFSASSFKVKTSKGWKKNHVKDPLKSKGKKREHAYKITWKKRKDVDGYFVYRINVKPAEKGKIKSWQYCEIGTEGNQFAPVGVTAKKYCKKVKTLKAGATSYTFKLKDKYYPEREHTAYAIVPYIKQNGKIYKADAKKVFAVTGYRSMLGHSSLPCEKHEAVYGACYSITLRTTDYSRYIPFAL